MRALFRRRRAAATPDTTRYRAAPRVVCAGQGARTVLLDPRQGEYFGINEVGAAIWRMLGPGATLADLVEGLEREFEAPRARLEQDAAEFVACLCRRKLVVEA